MSQLEQDNTLLDLYDLQLITHTGRCDELITIWGKLHACDLAIKHVFDALDFFHLGE